MESDCIEYKDIDFLPPLMSDYLNQPTKLSSYYNHESNLEGFRKAIRERSFTDQKRKILVDVLKSQYKNLSKKEKQETQFGLLLAPTTFTVTTGHQLCLATGPLYFIYKILSVVKLAKQLKQQFPANDFVPVYWMATEDHDFLEINHFHTTKKKYEWKGRNDVAVGWKQPKINDLIQQLKGEIDPSESGKKWLELLSEAYAQNNLAEATRFLVHNLLGKYGVVIVDGDDRRLKEIFSPFMLQELNNGTTELEVNKTVANLNLENYKEQVTPRDINLFYLGKTERSRITRDGNGYSLADDSRKWSHAEIKSELEQHPERFSPNVLMRPIFQETILPNLAYIGGAGELNYWFQLKSSFMAFNVDFPILMLRNSAFIVSKNDNKRMKKLGLKWKDLFSTIPALENLIIELHGNPQLNLDTFRSKIDGIYDELKELAKNVDTTLEPSSEVSRTRSQKALNRLEKKLIRGEKLNLASQMDMLHTVRDTVFPNGNFQERYLNLSSFYPDFGDQLFELLLDKFNPLAPNILVLEG